MPLKATGFEFLILAILKISKLLSENFYKFSQILRIVVNRFRSQTNKSSEEPMDGRQRLGATTGNGIRQTHAMSRRSRWESVVRQMISK